METALADPSGALRMRELSNTRKSMSAKVVGAENPDFKSQQASFLFLLIMALGLLIRAFLLYTTRNTWLMIEDEQHYHTLALNLLHGHGFTWEPGKLTSARPPLYPAFVALIWGITGTESVLTVRVAQICLALGNVYLVYRLGLLLFDRRVALLATAGLCFYPSLLAFNVFILTEVLFTFLLTLTVFGVVILINKGSVWIALGTGAVLGLAALTRSVLWPFPAVLCPFVFLIAPGSRSRRLWNATLLFVGYATVVAPWAIRNTRLQDVFTMVDTMGGITLRMGNYEHTPLDRAWDPVTLHGDKSILQGLGDEHPEVSSWTEGQREKWAFKRAVIYMLEHPGLTVQRSVIKFANFWGLERTVIAGWQQGLYRPSQWFAVLGILVIPIFYVVVMLLASLGIFLSRPADRRTHVLLLLVMCFLSGIHSLTFGHERYHLPVIPFLLLYAAAAVIQRSWQEIRESLRLAATPAAACFGLLFIWGREVLIVDADRIQSLLQLLF
jgi:4-amino-4-deoxy-L-arabinose transferase-like glycosyltransferase